MARSTFIPYGRLPQHQIATVQIRLQAAGNSQPNKLSHTPGGKLFDQNANDGGADAKLPGSEYTPFTINRGRATGRLTGGNLSLLAALAGTPFQPSFAGKIVFIEDVGEQPYRIDRLFTQLLQATDLQQAAGIALGVFIDCAAKTPSYSLTLTATLQDRLGNLGIPVVYGLPFGHVPEQVTFPYGVLADFDAGGRRLTFLEAGVV